MHPCIPKFILYVSLVCVVLPRGFAQQVEDIRDTFDQSGQYFLLQYDLKKASFKEEVFIQPRILNAPSDSIALKSLRGDFGWVPVKGKRKTITWDPFRDGVNDIDGLQLGLEEDLPTRPAVLPRYWALSWNASNSAPLGLKITRLSPIGFFVGYRRSWYLKPLDNALTTVADQPATIANYKTDGVYEIGEESRLCSWAATGGVVVQVARRVYVYGGVGYGAEQLYWKYDILNPDYEQINQSWVINKEINSEGVVFDAGAYLRFGRFVIDIGASTIQFNTNAQIIGGLGYTLTK